MILRLFFYSLNDSVDIPPAGSMDPVSFPLFIVKSFISHLFVLMYPLVSVYYLIPIYPFIHYYFII